MYSRRVCSTWAGAAADVMLERPSVISMISPVPQLYVHTSSFVASPFVHGTLVAPLGPVFARVGAPDLRQALPVVAQARDSFSFFLEAGRQIGLLRVELGPQGRQL